MGSRGLLGDLGLGTGQEPEGRPVWRMALWGRTAGEVTAGGWVTFADHMSLIVGGGGTRRARLAEEVLDWAEQ